MLQPRVADDFAAIRARMEELRREQQGRPTGDEIVVLAGVKRRLVATHKPLSPAIRRLLSRLTR
jgi:hypothetical protein